MVALKWVLFLHSYSCVTEVVMCKLFPYSSDSWILTRVKAVHKSDIDFCNIKNVSTMSSSGALGPEEHEEIFWDFYEKYSMFLRFPAVWLSCPKLSEFFWSYITVLENSSMRTVWLSRHFLFCFSGYVFKLNSPSADSSGAFHKNPCHLRKKRFPKLQPFFIYYFLNFECFN